MIWDLFGGRTIKLLHARLGPKCQNDGPSNCRGWTQRAKLSRKRLPRGPGTFWDARFERFGSDMRRIFEHFVISKLKIKNWKIENWKIGRLKIQNCKCRLVNYILWTSIILGGSGWLSGWSEWWDFNGNACIQEYIGTPTEATATFWTTHVAGHALASIYQTHRFPLFALCHLSPKRPKKGVPPLRSIEVHRVGL